MVALQGADAGRTKGNDDAGVGEQVRTWQRLFWGTSADGVDGVLGNRCGQGRWCPEDQSRTGPMVCRVTGALGMRNEDRVMDLVNTIDES